MPAAADNRVVMSEYVGKWGDGQTGRQGGRFGTRKQAFVGDGWMCMKLSMQLGQAGRWVSGGRSGVALSVYRVSLIGCADHIDTDRERQRERERAISVELFGPIYLL